MLKRYKPPIQPDGIKTKFELPSAYIGGTITIFVNGQMLYSQDNTNDIFGYTLDEYNKTFTFYTPLENGDFLYVMYDSNGSSDAASDFSGKGLMRLSPGYNLISYQGMQKAHWNKNTSEVNYTGEILANVKNLIIDQIEDVYGVPADNIIREIQTYSDDTQSYYTFKPGITGVSWCGNAEHFYNQDLYRAAGNFEYGDPNDNNYVAYTPDNFILSNCKLDSSLNLISLDKDNAIVDLPMGLRTGLMIYVKLDADLSSTGNALEIWF